MAGSVNGLGLVPGYGIEPALLMEDLLADHGDRRCEEDAEGADLLQGHFHGFRHTQTDAVGGLGHVLAELDRQLPGVDIFQRNGSLLGAGHDLFRDKQHVVGLGKHGLSVFLSHVADIVLVGDQMGGDGQPTILDPVYLNDLIFALIWLYFFAHPSVSYFRFSIFW